MLPRILEPELMDSVAEAVDYDSMDHTQVNRLFADDFLRLAPEPRGGSQTSVLDVGTGTAQIPIEICRRRNDLRVTAIDLAGHILQVAQRNINREGLSEKIRLDKSTPNRSRFLPKRLTPSFRTALFIIFPSHNACF